MSYWFVTFIFLYIILKFKFLWGLSIRQNGETMMNILNFHVNMERKTSELGNLYLSSPHAESDLEILFTKMLKK